jgi:hypothetical protein
VDGAYHKGCLEEEDLSLREENCKGNFEEIGGIDESKVIDESQICNSFMKIFFVFSNLELKFQTGEFFDGCEAALLLGFK